MVFQCHCSKLKEVLDKKTCSGLKLNKDKTEAYWLSSSHNCKQDLGLETVNEPMKILGIYFTYNSRLKRELNFDETRIKILKENLE